MLGKTRTSTHLMLVVCCWCALMRMVMTLPLSLDVDHSKVDRSRLKELLKQLSSLDEQSNSIGATTTVQPETLLEAEVPKPSKRNCQVGLSNDCGPAHSAYMAGMKKFLSSKRELEDTRSISSVGMLLDDWDNSVQSPRGNDRELVYGDSPDDDVFQNVMLLYIQRLASQRHRELESYERLCRMMTGQPCRWQSERIVQQL